MAPSSINLLVSAIGGSMLIAPTHPACTMLTKIYTSFLKTPNAAVDTTTTITDHLVHINQTLQQIKIDSTSYESCDAKFQCH